MPTIYQAEMSIWQVEHFAVRIYYPNNQDIRSDKKGYPRFKYGKAAPKSWTVHEWRRKRFRSIYPGYKVAILDADGKSVNGNKSLAVVRKSYKFALKDAEEE
jgi:hypothetical protein